MNHETGPFFTVKVTRCGECPHLAGDESCWLVPGMWPHPSKPYDAVRKNRHGITPSCPMWAKVQTEPPKD